jgi:hypothetical protein
LWIHARNSSSGAPGVHNSTVFLLARHHQYE